MWGKAGDLAHQKGREMDSWHQTVEEVRRLRCWKARGTGLAQHESSLMHRVRILCVICALVFCISDSCNREPYLTVSICFRRINHMAVKNHLHSSSGV
jgi:hypothetical protein